MLSSHGCYFAFVYARYSIDVGARRELKKGKQFRLNRFTERLITWLNVLLIIGLGLGAFLVNFNDMFDIAEQ